MTATTARGKSRARARTFGPLQGKALADTHITAISLTRSGALGPSAAMLRHETGRLAPGRTRALCNIGDVLSAEGFFPVES